jgi:hypothetical protein
MGPSFKFEIVYWVRGIGHAIQKFSFMGPAHAVGGST